MRNIKLTIEYDGTNYHGWQSQINAIAVQEVVVKAIKKLTGEEVNLTGSSRTDVGVHAMGQVANFFTNSGIPGDRFSYALNSVLPDDIVIKESVEVDAGFHARFSTVGKTYRYIFYNSVKPSALLRDRAYHIPYQLDIEAMKRAAACCIGEHDFSSFRAAGSSVKSSIRTVTDISLKIMKDNQFFINSSADSSGGTTYSNKSDSSTGEAKKTIERCKISPETRLIELEIAGNGFLYNMVRIIAGTLVEIGKGKIQEDMTDIIESRNRKRAGNTAPPQGLYLVEIYY